MPVLVSDRRAARDKLGDCISDRGGHGGVCRVDLAAGDSVRMAGHRRSGAGWLDV